MTSVRVPQSQPQGTFTITAEFDSGPLAGVVRTSQSVELKR